MYLKRLWTSYFPGKCCESYSQLAHQCRRIVATFRYSAMMVPERSHSASNKMYIVDYRYLCGNTELLSKTILHFKNSFDNFQLKPGKECISRRLHHSVGYYCCRPVSPCPLLMGNLYRVRSDTNIKHSLLDQRCSCFYSTSSGSEDTSPDFIALAKDVIEAAKRVDVMAGSVPLIKVVTLLKALHGQGFRVDNLVKVLTQQVQFLFEPENTIQLTELLLSHGLKHYVVVDVLRKLPLDVRQVSLQNIRTLIDVSLRHLMVMGFSERDLHSLLARGSEILFTNSNTRDSVLSMLKGLFTREDALSIIKRFPNIISDPWRETNEKFDYAYFTMGYKQQEIRKSSLFEHSLEHIQDRHLFLLRAGLFYPVKEKDDWKLNPNPPLSEVIDTVNEYFARTFVGVSLEEYEAYLKMREFEREEEDVGDDSEEEEQHAHKKKKERNQRRK